MGFLFELKVITTGKISQVSSSEFSNGRLLEAQDETEYRKLFHFLADSYLLELGLHF